MSEPFQFTGDHWVVALIALIPAVLNLALLAYVLWSGKRESPTYVFALFVGALATWQFSDALVRLSATEATAAFWSRYLAIGALIIGPAGLHFALHFTGHTERARRPSTLISLYGPALLINAFTAAGANPMQLVPSPRWAWEAARPAPLVNQLYGIWIASIALGMLVLLGRFAVRTEPSDPKRRQALLVALGFAVPTLQGTLTEVIFPTFVGIDSLPIASTMMTTFSVATFVALRRFEFLQLPTLEDRLATAQAALERDRRTLAHAEQVAHLGSWEWDFTSQAITWSPEMFRLYGVDVATFHPSSEAIQAQLHKEDRENFVQTIREAVSSNHPFEFEHRIVRANGEVRWVVAHGQVVADGTGKPARLVGTSQDITDRRKATNERSELERLRSLDEFKTQFLNMAAHELNTPLTPIKAQLYLLQTDPHRPQAPRTRQSLDILSRNLERLERLVNDLLDAARIQSGRLAIKPVPTRLEPLVDEVVNAFASTAQEARVGLSGAVRGAVVAWADPLRVSQILYNLVSNAIKFTPAGGLIHVAGWQEGAEAFLSVHDTGVGLVPEQTDRLFRPFSRVHETSSSTVRGTGLGLYVSKALAESHGGRLWVRSAGQGLGATFYVALPLSPRAEATISLRTREPRPATGPRPFDLVPPAP